MSKFWNQETLNAIIKYKESSIEERNSIWIESLALPFNKVAEVMINTLSCDYLKNYSGGSLRDEVVSKMVEAIDKFDATKSNGFGYFSSTARWYIIWKNKQRYLQLSKSEEYTEPTVDQNGHLTNASLHCFAEWQATRSGSVLADPEFIEQAQRYWQNFDWEIPKLTTKQKAAAKYIVVDMLKMLKGEELEIEGKWPAKWMYANAIASTARIALNFIQTTNSKLINTYANEGELWKVNHI